MRENTRWNNFRKFPPFTIFKNCIFSYFLNFFIRRLCAICVQVVQVISGRSQDLQTINYFTTNVAILLDSQFFGSGCAYFFFADLPLESLSPDGVAQIFSKLYLKRHAIEQLPAQDQIGFLSAISSLATVQYCPKSVMHKTIDYLVNQLLKENNNENDSDRTNLCEHSFEMISFVIKSHPSLTSYLINHIELCQKTLNPENNGESSNENNNALNSAINTVLTTITSQTTTQSNKQLSTRVACKLSFS